MKDYFELLKAFFCRRFGILEQFTRDSFGHNQIIPFLRRFVVSRWHYWLKKVNRKTRKK